jgi:signal transduction histidine kinase
LFAISSTLDALSARLGERSEFARFIDNLQAQVSRLGKLMADLLAYGRPPAGDFRVGTLESIVAPAVDACDALARDAGVTITTRHDASAPPVRLDQERMVLALRNLVDNAIRYAPRGSEIFVETRAVDDGGRRFAECTVRDGGPGFDDADLTRVFEPFFTRRQGGTGMGLALVQRIAIEHGGEVLAANAASGGALISLRLPAAQALA